MSLTFESGIFSLAYFFSLLGVTLTCKITGLELFLLWIVLLLFF